jgi:hypothetical protein
MFDVFFAILLAAFAALTWALLVLCDRLMGVTHERK